MACCSKAPAPHRPRRPAPMVAVIRAHPLSPPCSLFGRRHLHAPPLDLPSAGLPAVLAAARGLEWADEHREADATRARMLTDRIRAEVPRSVADVALLGGDDRVAYLTALSCLFVDGEALVLGLDREGYAISSGSSCVSDLRRPSHVLVAMGALTQGNVRVSLPFGVTDETVDGFIEAMPRVVRDVRAMLHADDLGSDELRSDERGEEGRA